VIPKGLMDEIKRWIKDGLYGHLQINFSGGKIMSVNRVQTCKVEMLVINLNEPSHTSNIDQADIIKSKGTESPS